MNDTQKLLQLLNDIDSIDTFVKTSYMDKKIDEQTTREILRLIREAQERALK